jgi:hypothetical protein
MGIIRIHEKAGKTKRKPGWQQKEAEYTAWLKSVQTMTSGIQPQGKGLRNPVQKKVVLVEDVPVRKAAFVVSGGTKPVHRPEIVYKDDPEMLARERAARERKFNVAPAYNKGPTIFVSEEDITAQLVGGRRR